MDTNSCMFNPEQQQMELPAGFRFHPTDEELISHYLLHKGLDTNFSPAAIGEADFTKCEPWDLPKRAKMGENEWYFFCLKDRKYPTGLRTNRATEAGYWKATGKDKEVYKGKSLVGMKKTLVFYKGRAPRGEKSNWVMHEYRLDGKFCPQNLPNSAKSEWVICRVFHKNSSGRKVPFCPSLPPLTDSSPRPALRHVSCFSSSMIAPQETARHGQALNPSYLPQMSLLKGVPQYPDGNFHENHALRSMSRDTGLSSEMNAEISSAVSGYEMASRGPLDGDEGPLGFSGPAYTGSYWSWS